MSSIYIVFHNELTYLPQALLSLQKLCNKNDLILSIIHNYDSLDRYKLFLKNYNDIHKVITVDYNTTILDILQPYVHRYEKFIMLNSDILILDTLINDLQSINNKYITNYNCQNIGLGVFDRNKIIELIRNQNTFYELSDKLKNISKDDPTILSTNLISQQKTTEPDNVFYEDENCLFCIIDQKGGIARSVVYMNKNNKKIFNVKNNIFGNVKEYTGNSLVVDWKLENEFKVLSYGKLNSIYV